MNGTSHLLIGGGGAIFRGKVKKIHCCVRGGGHYMKSKNIGGGVFCQLNLISKKRTKCKNAQKM